MWSKRKSPPQQKILLLTAAHQDSLTSTLVGSDKASGEWRKQVLVRCWEQGNTRPRTQLLSPPRKGGWKLWDRGRGTTQDKTTPWAPRGGRRQCEPRQRSAQVKQNTAKSQRGGGWEPSKRPEWNWGAQNRQQDTDPVRRGAPMRGEAGNRTTATRPRSEREKAWSVQRKRRAHEWKRRCWESTLGCKAKNGGPRNCQSPKERTPECTTLPGFHRKWGTQRDKTT